MGLQAQLPLRVALAGLDRQAGVELGQRAVHGLHEEILEVQLLVDRQILVGLRDHDLDFAALLTTSSEPIFGLTQIQSTPSGTGRVPLVSIAMVKPTACMASISGLSSCSSGSPAGEHHILAGGISFRPQRVDGRGQFLGRLELAAAFAVGADKVGVAELANGAGAVAFAAGPQVAAGKAAEHGGAAGLGAFALQGVEDFFDAIGHGDAPLTR